MNLEQLERVKRLARSMRAELETDSTGSAWITNVLTELETKINEELRNFVWRRYVEAKG